MPRRSQDRTQTEYVRYKEATTGQDAGGPYHHPAGVPRIRSKPEFISINPGDKASSYEVQLTKG
jgi:hypothetical protein